MKNEPITLTLALTVTYIPNGVTEEELIHLLSNVANHAGHRGLLTGETEAEVEVWGRNILRGDTLATVSEWNDDDLAAAEQDDNGQTSLDLATLHARAEALQVVA
jgi:hypothetical protein